MRRGLLLIDRGSRQREASEELETICSEIMSRGRHAFVDFCFLEVEPPYIEDGIARCLRQDIDSLTIVPYFLYSGKKVKCAVTDVMKLQKTTDVKFVVTKPMNMHPTLASLVRNRISTTMAENHVTVPEKDVDVMLIGHGSMDPNARMSLDYIVNALKGSYRNVSRCWLEIEQPDIFEGVKTCSENKPRVLIVVFYFLHEGAHVKTDINNDLIPALANSGIKTFYTTKHLGTDPKMIDLIMARAGDVEDAD